MTLPQHADKERRGQTDHTATFNAFHLGRYEFQWIWPPLPPLPPNVQLGDAP